MVESGTDLPKAPWTGTYLQNGLQSRKHHSLKPVSYTHLENLPAIDYNDNTSYFDYANTVLLACGFETLEEAWVAAEEYAEMSDLTMAEEMKMCIRDRYHTGCLIYK